MIQHLSSILVIAACMTPGLATALPAPTFPAELPGLCPDVRHGCLYRDASEDTGVQEERLIALAEAETRNGRYLGVGTDYPISRSGAVGIMQVTPETAQDHCPDLDPTTPHGSIHCGARVLAQYERRVGAAHAIAAYNAGPGAAHAIAAYNAGPGAVERYGGTPPYQETIRHGRNYREALRRIRSTT